MVLPQRILQRGAFSGVFSQKHKQWKMNLRAGEYSHQAGLVCATMITVTLTV